MPTTAQTQPTTLPATVADVRRSAAENAAGWGAESRCAAAELALLEGSIEAQSGHHRALASLARQLGALGSTAQALALRLEQQQWLAQGAEHLAADAAQARAAAARGSHAALLAAEALAQTVQSAHAIAQTEDNGSAVAHGARTAAEACLEAARVLDELDRDAHDAAGAGARLHGHPLAEAARQAHAVVRQLAAAVDTARTLAAEQCSASQGELTRLHRQQAERATAGHRAEAELAGWQALLGGLPGGPAAAGEAWPSKGAAAKAAETEARTLHAHRQSATRRAQAQQTEALALQQALQAPLLAARALTPAMQAAQQAAQEAEPWAGGLPRRCASALRLACSLEARQQLAGQALQTLGSARSKALARGSPPHATLDAALASAVQQHQAALSEVAATLPLLAAALCSAGRAAAAAATLVAGGHAEAGAVPAAEVQAGLLAELASLAQAQDQAVQAHAQAVAAAVTAEAEAQATLLHCIRLQAVVPD